MDDPRRLLPPANLRLAAARQLELFGRTVELLWLPERRNRPGRPIETRPAAAADHGAQIVAKEAVWRTAHVALTPNLHPFAATHALLWRTDFVREADHTLLDAGTELTAKGGGSLLVNSIGAAASIVRAHAHLLDDRVPFLTSLRYEPVEPTAFRLEPAVHLERAAAPFPCLLLRVTGPRAARVATTLLLIRHRTTAAFNLIDDGTATWFCPRTVEVPRPFFPQALGSAEIWGRWCWDDEAEFRAATADDLTQALAAAGMPRTARL